MGHFAGPDSDVEAAAARLLPPPPAPQPLVAVEVLRPVVAHGGVSGTGRWNVGEVAGFPPDVAASLIARGVARPAPLPQPKAPSVPPAHKMVKGAPIKK